MQSAQARQDMRTLIDAVPGARSPLAIVLLSGSFTAPEDFVREGFIDALRDRGIEAQVVMAEVRMAYFADDSVVRRIRESAVQPARQRGATRVWLAGISLGGLAAVCYRARHPGEIEGMLLMSPYPGTRDVLREIDAAGGLAQWNPAVAPEGDLEREAWSWLAAHGAATPDVHCYFGSEDRFVSGQRKMAQAMAPDCVRETSGGHDWPDWRRMWIDFLGRGKLR
jgi:pimeloyl-ACP methyl ester carboxylesterase